MNWKDEYKALILIFGFFLFGYLMPIGNERFNGAIFEALSLTKWYAQEHVILCLVPAFFIAGAISVFISQASVIKYFGASAKKWLSYSVAAVSGTILAVCSCTVLPLFSGIHKRGAGLGPAIAFLYSGPAINVLAIILTARILGLELGIARIIGAVSFSILIGLVMHFIYRKEEQKKVQSQLSLPEPESVRPLRQTVFYMFAMVAILIFANWGRPDSGEGLWFTLYNYKWWITGFFGILFAVSIILVLKVKTLYVILSLITVIVISIIFSGNPVIPFAASFVILSVVISFTRGEPQEWMRSTWGFTKQIMPLLALGVLAAGFLLGSPGGGGGIIPNRWIESLVGGNSLFANLFASVFGALMYFATLTEVPILQGLLNSGMGKGPALALLLSGPALSLPNVLVIRSVIGAQKTFVYVLLVVVMSSIAGLIFGSLF